MNKPERVLAAAARSRLDEYLDAVERALADTGMSRAERRAVCDEIDAQACEMVHSRAEGEPIEQDMKAVLAELDDPEAYRASVEPAVSAGPPRQPDDEPRIHRFALWAFLIPFIEFFLMFTPFHPHGEGPTFVTWGVVSLLCIVLGVMAIRDIRRRPDRYRGVGLAVFGMLAIPTMVFCVFGYVYAEQFDFLGYRKACVKKNFTELEERERQMAVAAHEYSTANNRGATHRPAAPSGLPDFVKRAKDQSARSLLGLTGELSPREKWLVKNRGTLEVVEGTIIVVAQLTVVALTFLVVYRCCRPRRRLASGLPEPESHSPTS